MPIVAVTYEFDFPGESKKHTIELDTEADYANDPVLAGLQRLLDDVDFNSVDLSDYDSSAVEELRWAFDDALQLEVILPKLQVSNFVLDLAEDELNFDVELDLWGTVFKDTDKFYEAAYSGLKPESSDAEIEEAISEYYGGSYHYFDILEVSFAVKS